MLNDRIAYVNGEFVDFPEVKIHLMSHSLGRGSAIFEVLSLHDTDDGPAVFRLDAHIKRFFRSAEFLDMEFSISREELHQAVLETVKQNRIRKGAIKIIGFYPQIAFNILPPQKELDVSIFVFDPEEDIGFNEIIRLADGTVDMGFSGKINKIVRLLLKDFCYRVLIGNVSLDKVVAGIVFDIFEIVQIAAIGQFVQIKYLALVVDV